MDRPSTAGLYLTKIGLGSFLGFVTKTRGAKKAQRENEISFFSSPRMRGEVDLRASEQVG